MIGKVIISSHLPFELNGNQPFRLVVRCTSPPEHATKSYSVIADYGWAERILCSGSSLRDANDIADALGDAMLIDVELATTEEAPRGGDGS